MNRKLTLLVAFTLLTAGCNDTQLTAPTTPDTAETARKPLGGDVTIDVKVTELADRRVRIHGTTNLPTGTELMLSVEERAQGGFYGQSKCSVLADGSYQSESFGPANGLKDGAYVAEVVMPIPRVQPGHVQEIIGTNGEKLSGPLVEAGNFGVTVSANKEFTIGGAQASQLQQQRARARVRQYREWLNKIVALHKRVQTAHSHNWLEDKSNAADLAKWGKFARQFRQDLISHQEQMMQLPIRARMSVGEPLDDIRKMFHCAAFRKAQDYKNASAQYAKSLKELQEFVAETERTP